MSKKIKFSAEYAIFPRPEYRDIERLHLVLEKKNTICYNDFNNPGNKIILNIIQIPGVWDHKFYVII